MTAATVYRYISALPLLAALTAPLSAQPAPSFPGVITGQVLAPDGKPVHAALVTAAIVSTVVPRKDRTETPLALSTRSILDGTFSISNVPLGDYIVCAQIESQAFLHTCRWG